MYRKLLASISVTLFMFANTQVASAGEQQYLESAPSYLNLQLPESTKYDLARYDEAVSPVFLASADDASSSKMKAMVEEEPVDYEDRLFTGNTIHKYLGIGSIGAALLAVLSPKEEDGPHEYFAKASAALGVGAVATGLVYHNEDVSLDGGFKDPDNLHALWAGLGAVGIAMAASTGPDSPHATYGSVGAIAMIIGIKYTW